MEVGDIIQENNREQNFSDTDDELIAGSVEESPSSFDTIIGHLEDIIIKENRFCYTDIHNSYVNTLFFLYNTSVLNCVITVNQFQAKTGATVDLALTNTYVSCPSDQPDPLMLLQKRLCTEPAVCKSLYADGEQTGVDQSIESMGTRLAQLDLDSLGSNTR
ncbi:hypothetical protein PHET_10552 [Paragonimus heterotremus]|uniref:Uncharacterized protein n=1 Tax=Paragonimus heterotremus TaxID=100268 RepID=A0A8J4SL66_9TREM|nr:hypothetical protein PHET_10552 [Paragonimus heterotremus]